MKTQDIFEEVDEPIHLWFSLSYCNYLVVPRSVLQSMPVEWQRKFVKLLNEMDEKIDWRSKLPGDYAVRMTRDGNRYAVDPFSDYERGRRVIPFRGEKE